ncbi:MAG: LacI family DNA-binding transcriptional regulator [Pannonibacter sp.]
MRVTADDVAEAAGVSRAMVSRAFTEGAPIAARKRAHVLAVAATLGYRPNRIARGLTGSQTGLIALVLGAVSRPYEAWLLETLSREIRTARYWPLLLQVQPGDELNNALEDALAYQVDGAIVAAGSVSPALAERCRSSGAPIVMVGRVLPGDDTDAVCCDNRLGLELLVDHLTRSGRKRLAWIGGTPDTFSNIERQNGLMEALDRRGLNLLAARTGDYSVDSGLAQALALLTAHDKPDAILCGNDAMALGAIAAARRLGMSVPGHVAIAGFDDIPAAAWEPYQLTTVRNPVLETSREALRLLTKRIQSDGTSGSPEGDAAPSPGFLARTAEVVRLAPELVIRQSA